MRAITWNEPGAQPALRDDLPEPTPAPGEVLVRVHASSVNLVDDGIAAGLMKDMMPHEFPGRYDAALKDGGRVSSATNAAGEGPGRTNVMAAPSPEILGRTAQQLADGTLKVPIQQTYDLVQAPDALHALGGAHTQGKLALRVAAPETPQ